MSINPLGGASWSPTFAMSSASQSTGGVVPNTRFGPNDPRNKLLTDDDRKAIRAATGIDVRANGSITSSIDMSLNDKVAALESVGQIAADRGNGALSGRLDPQLFDKILHDHGFTQAVQFPENGRVDTRA